MFFFKMILDDNELNDEKGYLEKTNATANRYQQLYLYFYGLCESESW